MVSGMEVRRIDIGPVELSVAEEGAGGAPLLLLHGFTGAKEDFVDSFGALADHGWHAVAPDHRGHGDSAQPADESAYSLQQLADDALALADRLGWERFVLLGHSMGGMVAQLMALSAPERLDALVLMDTGPAPVQVDRALRDLGVEIARTSGMVALAEAMAQRASPLTTPADLRVRAERPGYVEWNDAKLRACSPAMYAALAHEMLEQADRLPRLAGLQVPTLVIVGEQDQAFLAQSQAMASAIPGARLEVIADAGHSPQFEAPDAWWKALSGFLAEVRPAES